MNLNEWRPGQQPRSRLLYHSTTYPGGGARKKSLRSLAQFCPQLDRPSATTNKRSDRKHRGWLKTSMIAASPSLFRAWRFWVSSAHPREAESDSFLYSLRRQNKTEACDGAHATMHVVALIYTPRCGCQRGVA